MLRILFHLFTDINRAPDKFRRRPVKSERNGFTLVEMMVTLFILALLTTVVAINVLPNQDKAMAQKAKADIAVLGQAMETYRLDNSNPGRNGAFDIYSLGADGAPGGENDNADIYGE